MSVTELETAKEYLKITAEDPIQDALIQALLDGVEEVISSYIGSPLSPVYKTEVFNGGMRFWTPTFMPIIEIENEPLEIYHLDSAVFIDEEHYIVIDNRIYPAEPFLVELLDEVTGLPVIDPLTGEPVMVTEIRATNARWDLGRYKVTYYCGYTTTEAGMSLGSSFAVTTLPVGLKLAILLMLTRIWDNRGDAIEQDSGVAGKQKWGDLLAQYRDLRTLLAPYVKQGTIGV